MQLNADYPSYDTPGLIEEATLIVEGTAVAAEPTVLAPRYEGDTAEENPLLGLSDEEIVQALEADDGVVATAVSFRVDVVHRGAAEPGQEVTIVQTGGVIDGVTYRVEGEPPLISGESYLLFTADGFDGAYVILGGSAGAYIESREGVFAATQPDMAPSRQFTTSEVAELIG